MQYPTTDSCLRDLRGTFSKIASTLMYNQPDIDKRANGRDDYEVILMTGAWQAMLRWRVTPSRVCQGPKAERLYVLATLWNSLRSLDRARRAKRLDATVYPLFESDIVDETFGDRMVIRLDTAAVVERASAKQWDAFCFWVENGSYGCGTTVYRHCKIIKQRLQENLVDCVMSY